MSVIYSRPGTYRIIRHYFNGRKREINSGLTLEQAQQLCASSETSSSTARSSAGKARTRKYGAWFDGYSQE